MEIEIKNPKNLKDNEIDSFVTRVKIFLINNKKIIIANCNGCYQLPGGHAEENENLVATVKREILEETGISLEDNEIPSPFFEVRKYTKNYNNNGSNKLSKIIYYFVNTNKQPNLNNISLTEHEKQNNFCIDLIPLEDLENTLQNVIKNSEVEANKIIATETLNAFYKLKNIYKTKK